MKKYITIIFKLIFAYLLFRVLIGLYFAFSEDNMYMGTPNMYIKSNNIEDSKTKKIFISEYHYEIMDIPEYVLNNLGHLSEPIFYIEKKPKITSSFVLTEEGKELYASYNYQLVCQKSFRYRTDSWIPLKEIPDSVLINIYENGQVDLKKIGHFYVYKAGLRKGGNVVK